MCKLVFVYSWQWRVAQQYTQHAFLCFRNNDRSAVRQNITLHVHCPSCFIFFCFISLHPPYNFPLSNLLFSLLKTSTSLSDDSYTLFSISSSLFSISSCSFYSIWFLLWYSFSYFSLFSFLVHFISFHLPFALFPDSFFFVYLNYFLFLAFVV